MITKNIINKINKRYFNYNQNLCLFDVSLRDGLQSKSEIYTLNDKKKMLENIIINYNPDKIEVGSIVSSKILPQMDNSIDLYKHAIKLNNEKKYYLLIPNKNKLKVALDNNIKNMSFITSFSNSFQEKNIKKNLNETKKELEEIDQILYKNNLIENKLYISCFNKCPIEEELSMDSIIKDILYYEKFKSFDELCLSDTTGNLECSDFQELILDISRIINVNKLSLHLHVNKENINNTIDIIQLAFRLSIFKFDISFIDDGGCSVTMDKSKLNSNLNYNILEKLLD